jgi:hypothetical protein
MTILTHETPTDKSPRWSILSQIFVPQFWGAMAIVAMWLAVLFDGVYGGDVISSDGSHIPSVIFIAFFASLATWAIGKRTFGRTPSE